MSFFQVQICSLYLKMVAKCISACIHGSDKMILSLTFFCECLNKAKRVITNFFLLHFPNTDLLGFSPK